MLKECRIFLQKAAVFKLVKIQFYYTYQDSKLMEKLRKVQVLDVFTAKFYKNFREYLTFIIIKLFNEIKKEAVLLKLFLEASITSIPKSDKDSTKQEDYSSISVRNRNAKIFSKIPAKNM